MFGFPHQHRDKGFRYNKNLIRTAIFQLKFPKTSTIKENVKQFEEKLLPYFPEKKDVFGGHVQIKFEPAKTPIIKSGASSQEGFEFRADGDKKVFRITEDTFTYSILGEVYTNSNDALTEIEGHLSSIFGICGIEKINWISTRKINILEPAVPVNYPKTGLLSYAFGSILIDSILRLPQPAQVESGVNQIVLKTNGYKLNLRYGLLPIPPASKIENPQLILDIDLISEGEYSIKDVIPEWEKINSEIFNIFNWAISEQVKESLGK